MILDRDSNSSTFVIDEVLPDVDLMMIDSGFLENIEMTCESSKKRDCVIFSEVSRVCERDRIRKEIRKVCQEGALVPIWPSGLCPC